MFRLLEINTLQSNLQFIYRFNNESLFAKLSLLFYFSIKHCENVIFYDRKSIKN